MSEQPSNPQPRPTGSTHHLYNKEKRAVRPRDRPQDGAKSPDEAEFEQDNRTNPAMQYMMANLRRFGVVLGGMVVLLFISTLVLRMIWAYSDRKLERSSTSRSVAPAATPNSTGVLQQVQAPTNAPNAADLNTEALRRAVFLAKHGEALERSGNRAEAINRYREALDIWPYLTSVWGQLGRLYLLNRDYPRAQIALEKAVENNPGEAPLLNDLGVSYLYQGKTQKARDVFDAAMEVDPQYAPSLFNIALCYVNQNDAGNARDHLVRYLRLKSDDPRALRELAFLDALEKRYDDALEGLENALSYSADWPLLYFDAAAVTALMGRPDQAVSYLEKVEPLTDPATVYRLFQEPAFREIRLTELGKLFEQELAKRARERAEEKKEPVVVPTTSEPMWSASPPAAGAAR